MQTHSKIKEIMFTKVKQFLIFWNMSFVAILGNIHEEMYQIKPFEVEIGVLSVVSNIQFKIFNHMDWDILKLLKTTLDCLVLYEIFFLIIITPFKKDHFFL